MQMQEQIYRRESEEYASGEGSGKLYTAELEIDKAVNLFQEIGD